jgi:hypothetical protein
MKRNYNFGNRRVYEDGPRRVNSCTSLVIKKASVDLVWATLFMKFDPSLLRRLKEYSRHYKQMLKSYYIHWVSCTRYYSLQGQRACHEVTCPSSEVRILFERNWSQNSGTSSIVHTMIPIDRKEIFWDQFWHNIHWSHIEVFTYESNAEQFQSSITILWL